MSIAHKIHRQILDLQVAENKDTFALQTQFKNLYYDELLPIIEAELDRLSSSSNEVIQIDRLEIDLGKLILNAQFDQTVKDRLVKALEEAFYPIHSDYESGKTNGSLRLEISGDEVEWRKETQNISSFEAFISFLETGSIPWGAVLKNSELSGSVAASRVHVLIEEILEHKFHELVEYIKRNVSYTRVQQRIYHHFSLDQLKKLVVQSVSKDLGMSAKQLTDLQKEILAIAGVTMVPNSREERAIWWSFFLIVSGIQSNSIRLNSVLPLFITLVKQEFRLANLSLSDFFAFIETQPQNATQILLYTAKMGMDVPETIKRIRKLASKQASNQTKNADQTVSNLLAARRNVFQLNEILPVIDNDWFLEWNEMIQMETIVENEPKKEIFPIHDGKTHEKSASKILEEHGISVENAGLIILAYFLPHLFEHLGWIVDKKITEDALPKALSMTQFLVTGEEVVDEAALVLNKLILGIELDDPMTNDYVLTDEEKELGIDLVKNVINRWDALRSVSVEGFQQTFLIRDGIVYFRDNQYLLRVEKKTVDILMEKMPWSIGVIKLSWMPKMMITEW